MLKKLLETLEGLDAGIAALYKKGTDGKFHLDVEDDDYAELKRAKEHESGLRKIAEQEALQAKEKLTAATARIDELTASQNKGVQQVREELEGQWGKKLHDMEERHKAEKGTLEASVKKIYVDNVADAIANDISTVPDLLAESLRKRLVVEIVNGEPITRVLGVDGKPSIMTPDELKNEYFTNEKYASIMRASKASGGGATGNTGKNGGGAAKKLSEMGDAERKKLHRENPTEFRRLVAEDAAAAHR